VEGIAAVSVRIDLCGKEDIESGTVQKFEVEGHAIAVVRIDDDFYAIGDRCSHANYSLSEGEVLVEEKELECWKHGSTFSLETGKPTCLPATKPVPVYDIAVEGDRVLVVIN
jgi:3-phenylpropionate/trans-cinnamate dioxygenase ferredoxin subunit